MQSKGEGWGVGLSCHPIPTYPPNQWLTWKIRVWSGGGVAVSSKLHNNAVLQLVHPRLLTPPPPISNWPERWSVCRRGSTGSCNLLPAPQQCCCTLVHPQLLPLNTPFPPTNPPTPHPTHPHSQKLTWKLYSVWFTPPPPPNPHTHREKLTWKMKCVQEEEYCQL